MKNLKWFSYAFFLLCLTVFSANAQPSGVIDPAFAHSFENFTGTVTAIAKQTDGKIIVGGYFLSANNKDQFGLARFNADGSLDDSFNSSLGMFPTGIRSIVVQPDGKILVGGSFTAPSAQGSKNIVRLNSNGSEDTSFTGRTDSVVYAIAALPDGKILIGGTFTLVNGISKFGLAKLNSNGTLDTTFTYTIRTVTSIAVQPDGSILLGGNFAFTTPYVVNRIIRISATGSVDNSFTTNASADNTVRSVKLQSDGKILLGGSFTYINGKFRNNLARLNIDGTLDETFNPIVTANSVSNVESIDIDSTGKILFGGNFTSINGSFRSNVARLNADGSLDETFSHQTGASLPVRSVFADVSGIFIGGDFQKYNTDVKLRFAKLNTDGSINSEFNAALYSNGYVKKIKIQPDGKVIAAGSFFYVDGTDYGSIVRFNTDGTIDNSFARYNQSQVYADPVNDIALQPDGKIIVAGAISIANDPNNYGVVRLNSDGTIDRTFNPSNPYEVLTLKILPNGQILIGGNFLMVNAVDRSGLALLNSNGTIDNSFNPILQGPNSYKVVSDLFIRNDNKIIIGGYFDRVNGTSKNNIALINTNGTLDGSFTADAQGSVSRITELGTDSVLISGGFTSINGITRNRFAKISLSGQLDNSFNINNSVELPNYVVKPYLDGRILVAGNGNNSFAILNADGSIYKVFPTTQWFNKNIYDVAVQNNGKVIFAGAFTKVAGITRFGLARFNSLDFTTKVLYDYDGDGKADISVYRPTGGNWYVQNSSNNAFAASQFGASEDLIAPADFDGDGKTDLAVFRPSNGVWYRLNSSNNGFTATQFGSQGDLPVSADYDGDGKADVAVYRPSSGSWYRLNSSNGAFVSTQFGVAEDKPAVGDYDGDGKADIAVYRPSGGNWYRLNSSNGAFVANQFGVSTDKIVPADYDGDGKTDIAVYRPSNGTWYVSRSQAGFMSMQFGISTDLPAPADFDGDGKADIAVYRGGNWYIQRSTSGFTSIQFGTAADKPTPNAFVQ